MHDTNYRPSIEIRPIPGYPTLRARSDGKIFRVVDEKLIEQHPIPSSCVAGSVLPYPRFWLPRTKSGRVMVYVHHLVALAFIGPRPQGAQVRHMDGDSINTAASNIAYGTPRENNQDAIDHGTKARRFPPRKLSRELARLVRAQRASGMSVRDLADLYSVSTVCIYLVINGKTWRDSMTRAEKRALKGACMVNASLQNASLTSALLAPANLGGAT